jgi:uncharacterized protein (DUF1778 family)
LRYPANCRTIINSGNVVFAVPVMALSKKKEERLEARCSPEVKRRIEHAAGLQGRSMTDFVVATVYEQACKIIEQRQIIKLSMEESIVFANALINPPAPNAKAIKAARLHKKWMLKEKLLLAPLQPLVVRY